MGKKKISVKKRSLRKTPKRMLSRNFRLTSGQIQSLNSYLLRKRNTDIPNEKLEKLQKFEHTQNLMERCAAKLECQLHIEVNPNPKSKLPRLFHVVTKMYRDCLDELIEIRKELVKEKEKTNFLRGESGRAI
jgi:hypothetical protein